MSENSKSFINKTKNFFGVDSSCNELEYNAWNDRRLRFCVKKFGDLKLDKLELNSTTQSYTEPFRIQEPALQRSASHTLQSVVSRKAFAQGLQHSLVFPQTSLNATTQDSIHNRKHAFKAIGSLVHESLRLKKSIQNKRQPDNVTDSHFVELLPIDTTRVDDSEKVPRLTAQSGIDDAYDSGVTGDQYFPAQMDSAAGYEPMIEPPVTSKYVEPSHSEVYISNPQLKFSRSKRHSLKWTQSKTEKFRNQIQQLNVRRRFGNSLMGRMICCILSDETRSVEDKISTTSIYRPYFTYWVSVVQLIIYLIAVIVYGISPLKMKIRANQVGEVIVVSGSIEQVCRLEYVNLFVGPRQADLIRLGARYSPCMRLDANINQEIVAEQRERDRKSGCCQRNDGGGCYQTEEPFCSVTLANYRTKRKNVEGKFIPVVCGLDPEYCEDLRSQSPFLWPDDVTKWPICKTLSNSTRYPVSITSNIYHVHCEITGRPCCIGSKAECMVTTKQHCDFLRGHYHPYASLCSQVNCLSETCGMLGFDQPDKPNQGYRFITALFISPSLGSLIVILSFQLTVMRDLEKMAGWHRITLIYLLSGLFGNLCSGIFLPYQVQCGPSGSLFAMLAITFTEFLQSWHIIEHPWSVFFKFFGLGIFLFLLGFLPFFDNYAQVSGFISGILLSFIFLPFFGISNKRAYEKFTTSTINPESAVKLYQKQIEKKRIIIKLVCSVIWVALCTIFFILFYLYPVTSCSWCKYFNCIPLLDFCDNMDVNVTTKTACIIRAF